MGSVATPEFVLALRRQVGTGLLFMPAAAAVVSDEAGRVLFHQRTDSREWALPGGILEPGEQPATGAVREVREETGIVAEAHTLTGIYTGPEVTYPNGDRAQYVVSIFACRAVGGRLAPDPDESLDARFFPMDSLPSVSERTLERLKYALSGGPAHFDV